MKRARLIEEIDSFEQAKRVEETVKTGYAEVTQENIIQWMAVEEDLMNSYEKLARTLKETGQRELAERLQRESAGNLVALAELLQKVESLDAQRIKRIESVAKYSDDRGS